MKSTVSIDTKRLRCLIGWLGMLLPWLVVLITLSWPQSISITYYNIYAVGTFMVVLGSAGILLMCYKGYNRIDDIINTSAGICGLGVCAFPMSTIPGLTFDYETVGMFHLPPNVSNIFHSIFAIVFFGILAYNSMFLFTKTSGGMNKKKKIRNIIYRVCGIGMIASFLIMLFPKEILYNKTWITEMFALTFFGISWLTKANCYKWLASD